MVVVVTTFRRVPDEKDDDDDVGGGCGSSVLALPDQSVSAVAVVNNIPLFGWSILRMISSGLLYNATTGTNGHTKYTGTTTTDGTL